MALYAEISFSERSLQKKKSEAVFAITIQFFQNVHYSKPIRWLKRTMKVDAMSCNASTEIESHATLFNDSSRAVGLFL